LALSSGLCPLGEGPAWGVFVETRMLHELAAGGSLEILSDIRETN